MDDKKELQFVKNDLNSFLDVFSMLLKRGGEAVCLEPFNEYALKFVREVHPQYNQVKFYINAEERHIPLPDTVSVMSEDVTIDLIIIFETEAKLLSKLLMKYIDRKNATIIAPITGYYFENKPLFLISIPKAGTHLLYELARSFGYRDGIVCPDNPLPGTWYCIEYSNSHTSARNFFIDTVRSSSFGNRSHPFLKSPAIFIYRNPMDILMSEANYYHKDGKTAFYSYLSKYSFEERLLKLTDDPWLLGSIRDRIGDFIAWLEFQNVIPVSFEELIGSDGGGSLEAQTRLIWSLQLKLHVPGNPEKFGKGLFNKESATFYEGQIGTYRKHFTAQAYKKFYSLPQDFMKLFGYDSAEKDEPVKLPKRAEEFRKRLLSYSESEFDNMPINIELNYLGCNIVKYKGFYYGIPQRLGPIDLNRSDDSVLSKLFRGQDINSVKQEILLNKRHGIQNTCWFNFLKTIIKRDR